MKNIGGYCYEVARLVFLETLKGPDSRHDVSREQQTGAPTEREAEGARKEARMACLDECLGSAARRTAARSSSRITGMTGAIASHTRKALAERLELRLEALANRAQRLRDKLERCVTACLHGKSPT